MYVCLNFTPTVLAHTANIGFLSCCCCSTSRRCCIALLGSCRTTPRISTAFFDRHHFFGFRVFVAPLVVLVALGSATTFAASIACATDVPLPCTVASLESAYPRTRGTVRNHLCPETVLACDRRQCLRGRFQRFPKQVYHRSIGLPLAVRQGLTPTSLINRTVSHIDSVHALM